MPLFTSQHRLWQVRHAPFLRWSEAGQRYEASNALRSALVKSDLLIPGSEDPAPCFYIHCWKLPAAPAISRCSGREVSATLKPELKSSGFLSLLFLGLCLEAETLSLGVFPSGLFYCEENPCFFLFFTKVFYSMFILQALPSPSVSMAVQPSLLTDQVLKHLFHPPHLYQFSHSAYFFFSLFTAWASILLLFKAAFVHTSFFSEALATQEVSAQKKLNSNGEVSLFLSSFFSMAFFGNSVPNVLPFATASREPSCNVIHLGLSLKGKPDADRHTGEEGKETGKVQM